jgi:hypothetical protein
VVHELRWKDVLDALIEFRRDMRRRFGLKLREEIHAAPFIRNPGVLSRIPKHQRLEIIRRFADALASIQDINSVMVLIDKLSKPQDYDVFENAWRVLIQRFENTIRWQNFPGPKNADERGLLFADNTDGNKLTRLLRKLRVYNPIPNQPAYGSGYHNIPLTYAIEDSNLRDSSSSLFLQAADLCAFLLFQKVVPSKYMGRKGGRNYFGPLSPIVCRHAAPNDPNGIVRL